MGQFYLIINLDKKEYIHPNKFSCGMHINEFLRCKYGIMTGLGLLLADTNSMDSFCSRIEDGKVIGDGVIGRWAGDRVVIAGDYVTHLKYDFEFEDTKNNLYNVALLFYDDVSDEVLKNMLKDDEIALEYKMLKDNVL